MKILVSAVVMIFCISAYAKVPEECKDISEEIIGKELTISSIGEKISFNVESIGISDSKHTKYGISGLEDGLHFLENSTSPIHSLHFEYGMRTIVTRDSVLSGKGIEYAPASCQIILNDGFLNNRLDVNFRSDGILILTATISSERYERMPIKNVLYVLSDEKQMTLYQTLNP